MCRRMLYANFERPSSVALSSKRPGGAAWTRSGSYIPAWPPSLRTRSRVNSRKRGRHTSRSSPRRTGRWPHETRGEPSSTRWPVS